MTPEQYKAILNTNQNQATISAANHQNGTLLFGYDCDRNTWHVYKDDEKLNILVYRANKALVSLTTQETFNIEEVYPNKRIYADRSNYEFVKEIYQKADCPPSMIAPAPDADTSRLCSPLRIEDLA